MRTNVFWKLQVTRKFPLSYYYATIIIIVAIIKLCMLI